MLRSLTNSHYQLISARTANHHHLSNAYHVFRSNIELFNTPSVYCVQPLDVLHANARTQSNRHLVHRRNVHTSYRTGSSIYCNQRPLINISILPSLQNRESLIHGAKRLRTVGIRCLPDQLQIDFEWRISPN